MLQSLPIPLNDVPHQRSDLVESHLFQALYFRQVMIELAPVCPQLKAEAAQYFAASEETFFVVEKA
jgi:hypothetical protein